MGALSKLMRIVDPLVIVATGLLSYYFRFDDLDLPPTHQAAVLVVFGLSVIVFSSLDVYRVRVDVGLRRALLTLLGAWFGVIIGVVLLMYATKTGPLFSRQWLGVWSVIAFASLVFVRLVALATLRALFRRGVLTRRIAIAGAGKLGQEVARRLRASSWAGIDVVAFFDDSVALQGQTIDGVRVRGSVDRLKDDVRADRLDQVWIALPLRAEERVKRLLKDLVSAKVEIRFVPDIFGFQMLNHSFTEISGLPVVNITESPLSGMKGALKWVEDKILALFVLALAWPLMLAIAVGVKLSSPGPVIFRQRRGGLGSKEIVVWKFRTMVQHVECGEGQLTQARKGDQRVTRLGRFLRRTSLDELPQLINVLMGDMSIVGPRPHALEHNAFYLDKIPTYTLRSWIKPGITGWAQVCGWRGETDVTWKMEMRVQHDLYYIENWSLTLDLYIILLTLVRLRNPHAY